MAFGIITSGIVLSKFRPKARSVALYIFIIEIILTVSVLYAKTLQCPAPLFPETYLINERLEMDASCYGDCHCSTKVFQPVCSSNQMLNYFSPCHAGCTQETLLDFKSDKRVNDCVLWLTLLIVAQCSICVKLFSDCKCDEFGGEVTNGYCPTECNQFFTYITWFAIVGVITSTSKVGDTLITLRSFVQIFDFDFVSDFHFWLIIRCVDTKDKNFAIGITGAFLAIFGIH